jgi:hypothetical protein
MSWIKFSNLFKDEWDDCSFKMELLDSVDQDERIAWVVYGSFLGDSLGWMKREVPDLDGEKPIEAIKTESGKSKIKSTLMSMPR